MAYVFTNPYKATYLAAVQELEQLKAQLAYLQQRIPQIEETIRSLEPLIEDDGVPQTAGLTELCRQILTSQTTVRFTAEMVMQHLGWRGVDISGYSNPLATLHTTLTRLVKPGSGFYKISQSGTAPLYAYDPTVVSGVYHVTGNQLVKLDSAPGPNQPYRDTYIDYSKRGDP